MDLKVQGSIGGMTRWNLRLPIIARKHIDYTETIGSSFKMPIRALMLAMVAVVSGCASWEQQQALYLASERGDYLTVKRLLDHGTSPDFQVNDGGHFKSPLFVAAKGGHQTIVILMAERGANVNFQDWVTGRTVLMVAAASGDHECVDYLCSKGADPNMKGEHGETALMYAAFCGAVNCLDRLLKAGAHVDDWASEFWTADRLCVEIPGTALTWASRNGHKEAAEKLLNGGADPNGAPRGSWSPYFFPGSSRMAFASVEESPLMYAAQRNDIPMAECLLKHGASVDLRAPATGFTALIWAAQKNNLSMVRLIIQHGADPQIKDSRGFGPLHYASLDSHAAFSN